MENIEKRRDIKLVTSEHDAKKFTKKLNYNRYTIFSENLIAVHMDKIKPVYLGMGILDVSKTIMYDFHYNYIKREFGEKAELQYTDTDGLLCRIPTEDFYKFISGDVHQWFDTSNYPNETNERDEYT